MRMTNHSNLEIRRLDARIPIFPQISALVTFIFPFYSHFFSNVDDQSCFGSIKQLMCTLKVKLLLWFAFVTHVGKNLDKKT